MFMHTDLGTLLAEEAFDRPVRFERQRVWIAKQIFTKRLVLFKLAVFVAPRDHPWRIIAQSAFEDFRTLTEETLHPRDNR